MSAKLHPVLAGRLAINTKREREKRKLSQRALAARAGVSHPYVHMIEAQTRENVTLATVERIAEALGIDPSRLLREHT